MQNLMPVFNSKPGRKPLSSQCRKQLLAMVQAATPAATPAATSAATPAATPAQMRIEPIPILTTTVTPTTTECFICGTVKNCAKHLKRVLTNMDKLGALFPGGYKIVLSCDKSTDKSANVIEMYKRARTAITQTLDPNRIIVYFNEDPLTPTRTINIAKARNWCLDYIERLPESERPKYFIMMDCDDRCSMPIRTEPIAYYLSEERVEEWDGLSFNRNEYYDYWAFSKHPLTYSCWHFPGGHDIWKAYIQTMFAAAKPKTLIPVLSAFGGFAIYKTCVYGNCRYNGETAACAAIIPADMMTANIKRIGAPIQKMNTEDGDCEHRHFHYQAMLEHGARLFIAPEKIW